MDTPPARGRVLIVDDDGFTRRWLSDILAEEGLVILTAATGAEAMTVVQQENVDVVLLDIVLPDVPGLEVLERIHRFDPGVEVVVITGLKDADTAVGALRGRAFDYLVKPVVPAVARQTVGRALQTRRLIGENRMLRRALDLVTTGGRILSATAPEGVLRALLDGLVGMTRASRAVAAGPLGLLLRHGCDEAGAAALLEQAPPGTEEAVQIMAAHGGREPALGFVLSGGRARGVLERPAEPLGPDDVESARFLVRHAHNALGNLARFTAVSDAARRDHLTGLLNASVLAEGLAQAVARCGQSNGCCAVIFMDLDGFKGVNDTHGHLVGSRLLQEIAGLLQRALRGDDLVSRYGGDEFVCVLGDTTPEHARSVAERLRAAVGRQRFLQREGREVHVTVSVGLALFPQHSPDAAELLQRADAAMYASKRAGKNRVTAHGEYDPPT